MKREITKMRKEIIKFVWDNYKAKYNMSQLAQIFKMDLGNFFREIKKGQKLNKNK